jgi:DnaJ-class molecular chaperone
MPCDLCGKDEPLNAVPDIHHRLVFRVCTPCMKTHARERPSVPGKRSLKPLQMGGGDTVRLRLPPEIECPECGGGGGEDCADCGGTGGEWEKRPCSLCEGTGAYECYTCKGSGRKLLGPCSTCGGDTKVSCEKCGGDGVEERKHVCVTCTGSGHLCHRCSGRGVLRLYS